MIGHHDIAKIFGVKHSIVSAVIDQSDENLMQSGPFWSGSSYKEAVMQNKLELTPHMRRLLVMLDCIPDGAASLEKVMRSDGRVVYWIRRTYSASPTIAWDGREFHKVTGIGIEEWLAGERILLGN